MNKTTTVISRPYFDINITHRQDNEDDIAVIKEMFVDNVYRLEGWHFEQDDPIVLDIGANIGLFTLLALKIASESNRKITVYAVEPEKHNLELLQENLANNPRLFENGSEVIIVKGGISDFIGESFITNDAGGSRLVEESNQSIIVTTYNEFVNSNNLQHIDFVKIDIEGSEVPLIKVASKQNLLRAHYYAIEFDESKDSSDFIDILEPFLNDCSFETMGIPGVGCNLYIENHHWKQS